ncbi:hypothetical protein [Arthrobacter sp. HY1533]|uniref:hypothetical protein n=1 Tax=Arthrobacter sp. HY1533 TaxID=2970919 RepID=UPI0022B9F2FD|nr:hypothetical protein [Arthrobacter sp. HY1533]
MEYLVPLLIVLVIVIAAVVAVRLLGRRNRPAGNKTGNQAVGGPRRGREPTREDAVEASSRLSPQEHRRIYSMIAQGQVLNAVKEYRKATRLGLGESAAAVAALAQFPQPTPEPVVPAVSADPSAAGDAPAGDGTPATVEVVPGLPPMDANWTVEDIINAAPVDAPSPAPEAALPSAAVQAAAQQVPNPVAGSYRYRAIVSRGNDVREVASTRLNEQVFDAIKELARAGDRDGAAALLRGHAEIGAAEAREFVDMIGPED